MGSLINTRYTSLKPLGAPAEHRLLVDALVEIERLSSRRFCSLAFMVAERLGQAVFEIGSNLRGDIDRLQARFP